MTRKGTRWPEHYDPLVLGALAGLTGSVVRTLLELLAMAFVPHYRSCLRLAAATILSKSLSLNSPWVYLAGLEIDYTVGIVTGVAAVLILRTWGRDYLLFKGAIGGAITWALFYAVQSDFFCAIKTSGTAFESQVSFVIHLIFGIAVVSSARWYDRRKKHKA